MSDDVTRRMGTKADQRRLLLHLAGRVSALRAELGHVVDVMRQLELAMHNRSVMPRGRPTSPAITDGLRSEIRRLHGLGLNQHDIAAQLGTNVGRVNNALIGVRR